MSNSHLIEWPGFALAAIDTFRVRLDLSSQTRDAMITETEVWLISTKAPAARLYAGDSDGMFYAECGNRLLMFEMPARFDAWGADELGFSWEYSFCVMDDFGTAVPVDPFDHQSEGYGEILAPDFSAKVAIGEPYPYVRLTQTCH